MTGHKRLLYVFLLGAATLGLASPGRAEPFKFARIYIEYNSSARDLGYHITLDAEDWRSLKIVNPIGKTIFDVAGRGPYRDLGMTELFFEGAEPALADFPLDQLLALFPEGEYEFTAITTGKSKLLSLATLTHAVPDGPVVSAQVVASTVTIRWTLVTAPPTGFPDRPIVIAGYQIIAGTFQVTLPATRTEVTVPREYVESLGPGEHPFEVLAIEVGGNQTLTEGTFVLE